MSGLAGLFDESTRVLYVSTDDAFADLVQTKLAHQHDSFECYTTDSIASAESMLRSIEIDCVVTAYTLDDGTALDLVEMVRGEFGDLPVVLFTGKRSSVRSWDALEYDLTEFVQMNPDEDSFRRLGSRIRSVVSLHREREQTSQLKNRFERTLERTTDGIYAVDRNWRIEYYNQRIADRLGVEQGELVGKLLWDAHPLFGGSEYEPLFREAMESGEPVEFEQHIPEPFDYWVELRAFPDEGGLTVFSRQVTEARERQIELQRNETVLNNVHDVVFVIDSGRTIQFANPAAARTLDRRDPDRLVGRQLDELVSGMVDEKAVTQFREAVDATLSGMESDGGVKGLYDYDLQIDLDTTAGSRSFDVRLAPFASTDGKQVLVVARDVTDQSIIQRQLERERDALQGLQSVMSDSGLDSDERLTALLERGCETLDLDIGIVSNIVGDDYIVEAVYAPGTELSVGDVFDLEATYCEEVVASDRVCSFDDAIDAGKEDHPAYEAFQLEAYIGVPLTVDGERYGTLNFSSPNSRHQPFGDLEQTFTELLAELVSTELSRIKSRAKLERINDRLEQTINTAPLAILEVTPDGIVSRWNLGAQEMFGWTEEEAVGIPLPFVQEDRRAEFQAILEQVAAGNRLRGRHLRRLRKDGEIIDVLLSTAPIRGPNGEVQSVLAVLDDITDLKRLETRLRELQRTADKLNDAMTETEIAEIAVKTASDVLGLDITGLWVYDEVRDCLKPVAQTAEAIDVVGEGPEFEAGNSIAWQVYKSGDVQVYYDVDQIKGRFNEDTNIQSEILVPLGEHGILITGSTESRWFTDSEIDLFAILGATVEAAMGRANREEELRVQNERLDKFAAVVAHDLRNPLTVAKGFLEIAMESNNPDHFERVTVAHDRIERLISDLLTLSRGNVSVSEPTRLPLGDVVTEAWGYVDTDQATLDVEAELPVVDCDPGRLTQLFENLFRNAIEHGGNDVAIGVGQLDDASGFYVEDDGSGIPEERRDEVFEHGVSYSDTGTGFGLSIVATIAREHGWDVSVTEGTAGGARFEFVFDS